MCQREVGACKILTSAIAPSSKQLENLLTIVYRGKPMPVQCRRVAPRTSLYSSFDDPRGRAPIYEKGTTREPAMEQVWL